MDENKTTTTRVCKICLKPWKIEVFCDGEFKQEVPDCECYFKQAEKNSKAIINSIQKSIEIPWKHRDIIEKKLIDTNGYFVHQEIKEYVDLWVKGLRCNIVLSGNSYVGKSFDLAWAAWTIGQPVIYATPKEILLKLKAESFTYSGLIQIPILIIDDIDKVNSATEIKMLFDLIDPRDKSKRTVWVTHNKTRDELGKIIGLPIVNRLYDRATVVIKTRDIQGELIKNNTGDQKVS